MNKALLTLAFMFGLSTGFAAGTETPITIDVARRTSSISLNFTACCDYSIRAAVRNNGDDFACAGYDVNLVLGGTTSGCIYEGRIENVNEVVFEVPASSMPTNGKYTVQIMAMKNRVSNEWGRGTLRVNMNPGMNYMPTCWMGYEKVARLAASLLTTDVITNAVVSAILADLSSKVTVTIPASTNPCVRVLKSMTDDIPITSRFVWDGTNNVNMAFRNAAFAGAYFMIPSNRNMMASTFYLPMTNGMVETFMPERIGGKPWFRSTSVTNRKFMVRGGCVTDAMRDKVLHGEE